MRLTQETITPEVARDLLASTVGTTQRSISEAHVVRLAQAIRDGRWELTHQAIAISEQGIVIDGRHRLTAVVRAQTAVPMWVARGADPGTFTAVDTGRVRTPGDLLHIAGFTNTTALAATARYVMGARRVRGTRLSWQAIVGPIRHDEIVAFCEKNGADLDEALSVGYRLARGVGRYGLKTWLSAFVYMVRQSGVPVDIQNEFIERMSDGMMLGPGSPILALRRYIAQSFLDRNSPIRGAVGLAVTIKAFNTYVQGGQTQVATFRMGIEKFPAIAPWRPPTELPEELPLTEGAPDGS